MAGTLSSLAERVRKIEKELPDRVTAVTVEVALNLTKQLAAVETPVDTSQALSNWQAGVEVPPQNFLPPYSPGKGGSTRAQSAEETVAKARAALSGRKSGQVIYISNVAPYIRKLAYEGWSKQAPPGWIEASVMLAKKFVSTLRGQVLKDL